MTEPPAPSRDPFALPPPEELRRIAARQDERAREIKALRAKQLVAEAGSDEAAQTQAAEVIQRNFRGYRDRRALNGYGLDPSTRWLEAIKDASYANKTTPRSHQQRMSMSPSSSFARSRWRHANIIAQHAGSDDTSDSSSEVEGDVERARRREERRGKKKDREQYAKVMGMEYFLEMVDQKHRYGSNLRRYHQEWKKADTRENFFYWLDYGEGKELDLEDRPRERLDREQVRYLSREERQRYLVTIDAQGRFCYAKDGTPVTTSRGFKDSINGIVPVDDDTPTWREVTTGEKPEPRFPSTASSSSSASLSDLSTGGQEDGSKYSNTELHDAKGIQKLRHISADTVTNHLLRKTTKKNTWIFVADTSFRLYIGIKQSGAFQHSSFLKGARVAAAGLIKIKRGQIRKLNPLSGHYAPPVRNFREFVRNVKEDGADMSRCSVSRSYAVLLGLEGYLGVKRQVKSVERGVKEVLRPEEKKRREEEEMDRSESARREREVLRAEAEAARKEKKWNVRLMRKLGIGEEKEVEKVKDGRH